MATPLKVRGKTLGRPNAGACNATMDDGVRKKLFQKRFVRALAILWILARRFRRY